MERNSSLNRGFSLDRELDGVEPPPFSTAPDFEAENLWGWWVNRPGMVTFVPNVGQLKGRDCEAIAEYFALPRFREKFPNAEKYFFHHHFGNSRGYESDARIALVAWGKTFSRNHSGSIIEINANAGALERMGLATATTALALVGLSVDVVPSVADYCEEHRIRPARYGPCPDIR